MVSKILSALGMATLTRRCHSEVASDFLLATMMTTERRLTRRGMDTCALEAEWRRERGKKLARGYRIKMVGDAGEGSAAYGVRRSTWRWPRTQTDDNVGDETGPNQRSRE